MSCPGKLVMEADYPNTDSTASLKGTAMHAVAALCLTEHYGAAKYIGTKVPVGVGQAIAVTKDMAAEVQGYVDVVRYLGIGNVMLIEHRVDYSDFIGVPDSFGTADAIVLIPLDGGGFELFICDLKTGHHAVDPENNTQGLLYALGAYREFELTHDIRQVRIGIYQGGVLKEWTLPVGEL